MLFCAYCTSDRCCASDTPQDAGCMVLRSDRVVCNVRCYWGFNGRRVDCVPDDLQAYVEANGEIAKSSRASLLRQFLLLIRLREPAIVSQPQGVEAIFLIFENLANSSWQLAKQGEVSHQHSHSTKSRANVEEKRASTRQS
jgi:hypothetical protein